MVVAGGWGAFRFDKDNKLMSQLCCTNKAALPEMEDPTWRPYLVTDLTGKPWLTFMGGTAVNEQFVQHPGSPAVRELRDRIRPRAKNWTEQFRLAVAYGGVAVVDSTTVLAGTYDSNPFLRNAGDSIVYRVRGTGPAVAVAGRPGPHTTNPISALRPGEVVPATSVSLQPATAIIPLTADSFVILMPLPVNDDPVAANEGPEARLQAALVRGNTISRLALPELCAKDPYVSGSRISATSLVVNAPNPKNGSCEDRKIGLHENDDFRWVQVHSDGKPPVTLGNGAGLVTISGQDLVTAVMAPAVKQYDGMLQVTRRPLKTS
jgi:hypothetical protein